MILDLESPAKASRRNQSLRQAGTSIMQDTNAFEEEEPGSPKGTKPQFPMRAQVRTTLHCSVHEVSMGLEAPSAV